MFRSIEIVQKSLKIHTVNVTNKRSGFANCLNPFSNVSQHCRDPIEERAYFRTAHPGGGAVPENGRLHPLPAHENRERGECRASQRQVRVNGHAHPTRVPEGSGHQLCDAYHPRLRLKVR